jgi:hypothetical protein
MRRGRRARLAVAFVAASCLFAAGCRKKGLHTFDHAALEEHIRQGMREDGIEMKSLFCPAGLVLKVGDTFDCAGVDANGEHHVFIGTQHEDILQWRPDGFAYNLLKVGHSIEMDMGSPAHVDCPDKTLLLKKAQVFSCKVHHDGKERIVYFMTDDDEGNLTWMFSRRHDE